uniref:Acyltransferase PGAP2 n=1 Tax=Eptatretus burgeri TaxID=7764 RepID=A0A8C4RAN1_EPTBU
MMLPLYMTEPSGGEQLLRTKLTWLAVATLSCPFGAMIFWITWSLVFQFERSTATHCGVRAGRLSPPDPGPQQYVCLYCLSPPELALRPLFSRSSTHPPLPFLPPAPQTISEWKSRCWKQRFCVVNVTSIIVAVYVYNRHNQYCEPGAYTIFALVEYFFVFSNMAFHMTSYWEFAGCHLLIVSGIGDKSF